MMKLPEDTHIQQSEIKFVDSPLPLDAVMYGFVVDSDANSKNAQIMRRLMLLHDNPDWREIVLDGKQTKDHLNLQDCDKHFESPFAPFVDSFGQLLTLLNHKIERMKQFEDKILNQRNEDGLDWLVYRESVVVQVAGMCVEKEENNTKNYTIQSFLYRQGVDDINAILGDLLEQNLCVDGNGEAVTVRTALKIVRDKFICHFDNIEQYDLHGNDRVGGWSRGDMLVLLDLLLPMTSKMEGVVVKLIRTMNYIYERVLQKRRCEYIFKNQKTFETEK